MVWKWRFLLIHKQQTNLWMKLPTIPPELAGKIVKYRPLSEPIRLQDLEDSARSQAWKKIKYVLAHANEIPSRKRGLSGAPCTTYNWVRRQVTVNRPKSNRKSKLSTIGRSQFAKFLLTRHALPANILLRDAAKQMSSKEAWSQWLDLEKNFTDKWPVFSWFK